MKDQDNHSNSQWEKWILDAIRKVRFQKQRPSIERICSTVRQHQNQSVDSITEHLERLVNEGLVLRVFNKGKSSYKDPVGLRYRHFEVDKDTDLSKIAVKAVRELNDKDGSSLKNIAKYVQQSHILKLKPGVDLTSSIKSWLNKAIEKSLIIKEGKLYKLNADGNSDKTPKTPPPVPAKKSKTVSPPKTISTPKTSKKGSSNEQLSKKKKSGSRHRDKRRRSDSHSEWTDLSEEEETAVSQQVDTVTCGNEHISSISVLSSTSNGINGEKEVGTGRELEKQVKKKRSKEKRYINCMMLMSQVLTTSKNEHNVYGEYIANKLKNCKRNPIEISFAQNDINNILLNLELGHYEGHCDKRSREMVQRNASNNQFEYVNYSTNSGYEQSSSSQRNTNEDCNYVSSSSGYQGSSHYPSNYNYNPTRTDDELVQSYINNLASY